MASPPLTPRVIQGYDVTRHRIKRGQIGPFIAIAGGASPRQVLKRRRASVLLRDDMIWFVKDIGHLIREQTILAAAVSSCAYLALQGFWNMLLGRHALRGVLGEFALRFSFHEPHQMLDVHKALQLTLLSLSDLARAFLINQGIHAVGYLWGGMEGDDFLW